MTDIEYKAHPAADLFPLLEGKEFEALKADIKAHGINQRIVLWDSKQEMLLVDGRNRLRACRELGMELHPTDFEYLPNDIDPIDYIIGANIRRRHLTPGQCSAIAVELANLKRGGDRRSEAIKVSNETLKSTSLSESVKKVPGASIGTAKRLQSVKKADPDAFEAVKRGKLTPGAAEKRIKHAAAADLKDAGRQVGSIGRTPKPEPIDVAYAAIEPEPDEWDAAWDAAWDAWRKAFDAIADLKYFAIQHKDHDKIEALECEIKYFIGRLNVLAEDLIKAKPMGKPEAQADGTDSDFSESDTSTEPDAPKVGLWSPSEVSRWIRARMPDGDGLPIHNVIVTPCDERDRKVSPFYCAHHYRIHAFYASTIAPLDELENALRAIPGVYETQQVRNERYGNLRDLRYQVIALMGKLPKDPKDPTPSKAAHDVMQSVTAGLAEYAAAAVDEANLLCEAVENEAHEAVAKSPPAMKEVWADVALDQLAQERANEAHPDAIQNIVRSIAENGGEMNGKIRGALYTLAKALCEHVMPVFSRPTVTDKVRAILAAKVRELVEAKAA